MKELAAANSLIAISSFGSTAVGFAAAGLIASAANINWAFYLDAVTFIVSAICVYLIRIKPIQAEEETSVAVVIKNLRAGVRQLFETPILRSLFSVQVLVLIIIWFVKYPAVTIRLAGIECDRIRIRLAGRADIYRLRRWKFAHGEYYSIECAKAHGWQ